MKTKFRTLISLILSVLIIFSCTAVAFAEAEQVTPVIIVSGMGAKPLTNADKNEEIFPPSFNVIAVNVLKAILPVLGTVALTNGDIFDKYAAEPIHDIFEQMACDMDGKSVYNIIPAAYPESAGNYEDLQEDPASAEMGMILSTAKKIGWENTYYFNYDWRLSPLDHADDLQKMIEDVKAEHNCKKVSIFAMSMGGAITNAYLSKYGCDSLKNVVYGSTAFLGVDLVGQLFTGDIDINIISLLTYFATFAEGQKNMGLVAKIVNALNEAAKQDGMESTDAFIKKNIEAIKDSVFKTVFKDVFTTFYGIWSLVPADKFDDAVKTIKGYVDLSDSFIEKATEYIKIQKNAENLIKKSMAQGTEIYIIGAYGYAGIPLTSASSSHTDTLIDTYHMTGKCVVAPFGKTLEDVGDYPYDNACGNKSHYHISTDGVINAGVGMLPDRTWIIKNMTHVEFASEHQSSDLAVFVVTSENPINVYSDARYPQFTELNRKTGKLVSLTQNVTIPGSDEENGLSQVFRVILGKLIDMLKTLAGYVKGYLAKEVTA